MKKSCILTLLLSLTCISTLNAGIKERLAQRLPAINKMKQALLIGENNQGYLEAKGTLTPAQKSIVNAENADRKKIYAMIAKKTGTSISLVQKRRAEIIAKNSKSGIWLQKPDGTWYKK